MEVFQKRYFKSRVPFVLFILIVPLLFYLFIYKEKLPVYNPADLNPELVDSSLHTTDSNHTVADFRLINQNGDTITQEAYKDKIYIVDFFFTRCPSICPVMSNNMGKLQKRFWNTKKVMLLSLSVTPKMDSVPILKAYAERYNANSLKWNITTGDKNHIYELARKSYFAVNDYNDGLLQDFVHTSNFVLIDTQKQIRGIYDGTIDEEIDELAADIDLLLKDLDDT